MITSAVVHLSVRSRDHAFVRPNISPHASVTVQGKLFPRSALLLRVLRFFKGLLSYLLHFLRTKIKRPRAFSLKMPLNGVWDIGAGSAQNARTLS